MQPNAPFTPRPELTTEEKTRLARRFRRKANLTDTIGLAATLLMVIAAFLGRQDFDQGYPYLTAGAALFIVFGVASSVTYYRCPCCGNRIISGSLGQDRNLGPLVWRMYECPVCGFTPDWSR
jgi:predicted RNA-binding Zn-ribbon protein involved in translation (DUF1610 family)|nr:hypothetical protein [uncultured Oscillibacter sp.]